MTQRLSVQKPHLPTPCFRGFLSLGLGTLHLNEPLELVQKQ